RLVWPSVFEQDPQLHRDLPTWTGYLNLWEDLAKMQNYVKTTWGEKNIASWCIGISVLVTSIPGHEERWRGNFVAVTPAERFPDWLCFGYDVADASLASGLTNAAWRPIDRRAVGAEWEGQLNEFHL